MLASSRYLLRMPLIQAVRTGTRRLPKTLAFRTMATADIAGQLTEKSLRETAITLETVKKIVVEEVKQSVMPQLNNFVTKDEFKELKYEIRLVRTDLTDLFQRSLKAQAEIMESKFTIVDQKFEKIERVIQSQFREVQTQFEVMNTKMDERDKTINARFDALQKETGIKFDAFQNETGIKFDAFQTEMISQFKVLAEQIARKDDYARFFKNQRDTARWILGTIIFGGVLLGHRLGVFDKLVEDYISRKKATESSSRSNSPTV